MTAVARTWWGLVAIHQPLPCQDLVRRWRHHAGLEVNRRQCQRRDMREPRIGSDRMVGRTVLGTERRRFLHHLPAHLATLVGHLDRLGDRKSPRLNSRHYCAARMPSSAWKKTQIK